MVSNETTILDTVIYSKHEVILEIEILPWKYTAVWTLESSVFVWPGDEYNTTYYIGIFIAAL